MIGSAYFMVLFHRRFAFPWYRTMGGWLWRLLGATMLACAGVYIVQAMESPNLSTDRLTGLILLTVYGVFYLVLFGSGLTAFGFWSHGDIKIFRRVRLRLKLAK